MTDETIGGPIASSASHCVANSGGLASPASGGTVGPHVARKRRTRASCAASRIGVGSGIQRLRLKTPLLFARTSLAQSTISAGCMGKAPHAPSPPALATAIESDGALAPAIGPRRIGTRRPNRRQNALVRSKVELICCCPGMLGRSELQGRVSALHRRLASTAFYKISLELADSIFLIRRRDNFVRLEVRRSYVSGHRRPANEKRRRSWISPHRRCQWKTR